MQSKFRFFNISVLSACLLLAACAEKPIAPVIERAPVSTPQKPARIKAEPVRIAAQEKDWRPDTHTVKKGDTLFSLGLQYGEDYKEIARINQISPPYVIRVNQVLKLRETSTEKEAGSPVAPIAKPDVSKSETISQNPVTNPNENVILAPQQMESVNPVIQNEAPTQISRPKAMREPYSEKALSAVNPVANSTKTAKPAPDTVAVNPPESAKNPASKADTTVAGSTTDASKSTTDTAGDAKATAEKTSAAEVEDGIEWLWPTTGKLLASFNDGSSKGIDIGGVSGQAILAAARGKVIYAGSDLRGYGKLVIIKHNKNYLSVYAHNKQILVKEGQAIQKGQKISEMGNTDTDTIKLHFEIRFQGRSVDPSKYLPASQNP